MTHIRWPDAREEAAALSGSRAAGRLSTPTRTAYWGHHDESAAGQ